MKEYIVYRYYFDNVVYRREKIEFTKKELYKYLYDNQTEIDNIDVFKIEDKIKVKIDTKITLSEK